MKRQERQFRPVEERLTDHHDVHASADSTLAVNQAKRSMGCGVPFCHTGCPLGNLIPDWNDLIHRDDRRAAWRLLESTNNFPGVPHRRALFGSMRGCVRAFDQR